MLEKLCRLTEALEDLAKGKHAPWFEVQQMDPALREAVEFCDEGDTIDLLKHCWELLGDDGKAFSAIQKHCQKTGSPQQEVGARLYRNARARIATARAVVAARRYIQDTDPVANVIERLGEAGALFGHTSEVQVDTQNWSSTNPLELIRLGCDAYATQGTPVETVRLWALDLMGAGDSEAGFSVAVPVAACDGEGFLLTLRLTVMKRPGRELIEHPQMALRTFGQAMLQTLEAVWQRVWPGTSAPVRWELRATGEKSNEKLDGPSLGGALAVALRVLRDGLPYDASCLIAAQVDGVSLKAVGNEEEKLRAAAEAGIRRAVVGEGSQMSSRIAEFAESGVEIRVLHTISEAVEFASRQLTEIQRVLKVETQRVLEDAKARIRDRTFENWAELDDLFVPITVARGLRPRLSNDQYEKLERERREGQHRGIDELAWRRKETERDGRMDLRDEEAQTELRRITVEWEDVRAGIQRGVVSGDPGFGKTTLLWHEVGRRNEEWLAKIADNQASLEQAEVSVLVRALELAQWIEKEPLLEALLSHLRGRWHVSDATAKLVGTKLANGAGLIAIDALDEVPMDLRDKLDAALADFAATHNGARVLLSSRLVGYTRAPVKVEEQDEFEVLAFEPGQMEQAVQAWFAPDENAGAEAWRHIESESGVSGDLRCPLLLRLACALIGKAKNKGAAFPSWEYRAELYDGFLVHGVNLWSDRAKPGAQARGLFLDFACALALELCKTNARRTLWDQTEIARKVEALQKNYYALQKRDNLIGDLCDAGILSLAGPDDLTTPLMFTHRSFGEYLAARGLAQRLNDGEAAGWDLVEEKSWWADWEQVFLFLAGALSQHQAALKRLIDTLSDERTDDIVHYRLVLAVKCLAELPSTTLKFLGRSTTTVVGRAYTWWRELQTPAACAAMPAIAVADSKSGDKLITRGLRLLGDRDPSLASEATAALEEMGIAAAHEKVVSRLLECMRNPHRSIREKAALALGKIGAVTKSEILNQLLKLSFDSEAGVRSAAALALGRAGTAAASDEILDQLLALLDDHDFYVCSLAARALGGMGKRAACARIVNRLLELLRGGCYPAATPLIRIAAQSARDEILDQSARFLYSHDLHVQQSTVVALRELGQAAARDDIIDPLLWLLRKPGWIERRTVVATLWRIGSAPVRAEVLTQLFEWLRGPDRFLRLQALEGLFEIGMGEKEGLDELLGSLRDSDVRLQRAAVDALGKIGATAVREAPTRKAILNELLRMLRAEPWELLLGVAIALTRIGVLAAREDILYHLAELRDSPTFGSTATWTLEGFSKRGVHVFLRDGKLIIKRIATSPQVQ